MMGKSRDWTRACGSSWTLDQELGSLHETKVGPLLVGSSWVAWSVWGASGSGTRTSAWAGFLDLIYYVEMPCSALMKWGGTYSCFNLIWQALLTPHRRSYPFWGVDGWWVVGEVGRKQEEGKEGEQWLV